MIQICHQRGALATGGMAAKVLEGDDAEQVLFFFSNQLNVY